MTNSNMDVNANVNVNGNDYVRDYTCDYRPITIALELWNVIDTRKENEPHSFFNTVVDTIDIKGKTFVLIYNEK